VAHLASYKCARISIRAETLGWAECGKNENEDQIYLFIYSLRKNLKTKN
jgi:hypothetical protein